MKKKFSVGIVMGSKSDWPKLREAAKVLRQFGVNYQVSVVSAHRTPENMLPYIEKAQTNNFKVIIAGAGGAAHLPGMLASLTYLPVIGVPISTKSLQGIDSLLSIVQMPKGIPVATVAIDNSANAALLALRILATENPKLVKALEKHRKTMRMAVKKMNRSL